MRILDIDLDFFLDEIEYFRSRNNKRLNKKDYNPWNYRQVECFLENSFGLNQNYPIEGKIFTHHDELFTHVECEILQGKMHPPFVIHHLDAHSDFAMGIDNCSEYIMETLLFVDFNQRSSLIKKAKGFQN